MGQPLVGKAKIQKVKIAKATFYNLQTQLPTSVAWTFSLMLQALHHPLYNYPTKIFYEGNWSECVAISHVIEGINL